MRFTEVTIVPRYMIFTEAKAEVNIVYLGTIDLYINRNEIVLLYETVINVLWAMFYKLALNTTCGFFVNFNGNKKDLCILQR